MDKDARIYVAGHRGLVGSAIWNNLQSKGYTQLTGRTHTELDLLDSLAVRRFFDTEEPEYVSREEVQASASGEYEEVGGMLIDTGTGKDKYQTDPVPDGKPIPVEPENVEIGDAEYTCTLSISCATILDNMELCNKEKRELVPEDGWILKPMTVTFYEGESVFNILQRTCKQQKIHMEFENTPVYNSAYIEGINNLYEFDVGNTSGWMYKVNGWFPNYGCSRYQLQNGDVIEWVYTCDLGDDVGGGYATGSE